MISVYDSFSLCEDCDGTGLEATPQVDKNAVHQYADRLCSLIFLDKNVVLQYTDRLCSLTFFFLPIKTLCINNFLDKNVVLQYADRSCSLTYFFR